MHFRAFHLRWILINYKHNSYRKGNDTLVDRFTGHICKRKIEYISGKSNFAKCDLITTDLGFSRFVSPNRWRKLSERRRTHSKTWLPAAPPMLLLRGFYVSCVVPDRRSRPLMSKVSIAFHLVKHHGPRRCPAVEKRGCGDRPYWLTEYIWKTKRKYRYTRE